MSDEWRVEVDLDDEQHGFKLGERLGSLDLDDEVRERLGDRVVVSRDGAKIFLYAETEEQAREAERVALELVAAESLSAETSLTRWHPDADEWRGPAGPPPHTAGGAPAGGEYPGGAGGGGARARPPLGLPVGGPR